jgi:hypothetical protein
MFIHNSNSIDGSEKDESEPVDDFHVVQGNMAEATTNVFSGHAADAAKKELCVGFAVPALFVQESFYLGVRPILYVERVVFPVIAVVAVSGMCGVSGRVKAHKNAFLIRMDAHVFDAV